MPCILSAKLNPNIRNFLTSCLKENTYPATQNCTVIVNVYVSGIDVAVDVECRGKKKKCHGWGGGRGRGGGCRGRGGWGRGWGNFMFGPGFMARGGFFGPQGQQTGEGGESSSASRPSVEKAPDVDMATEQHSADGKPPSSPLDVQMGVRV